MCWFAAKTKRRAEFKAHEFFNSTGVNSYVPYFKTRRVWSDRIKNVIVPAISGYVFFELDKMNFNTLNMNPFTKNIVRDNSGKPAIIKDSEIKILKDQLNSNVKSDQKLNKLFVSLKEINAKLWVIEDDKRQCEKEKNFTDTFIKLTRDVHFLNDDRAKIKLEINNHTGSIIKEIKTYTSY